MYLLYGHSRTVILASILHIMLALLSTEKHEALCQNVCSEYMCIALNCTDDAEVINWLCDHEQVEPKGGVMTSARHKIPKMRLFCHHDVPKRSKFPELGDHEDEDSMPWILSGTQTDTHLHCLLLIHEGPKFDRHDRLTDTTKCLTPLALISVG